LRRRPSTHAQEAPPDTVVVEKFLFPNNPPPKLAGDFCAGGGASVQVQHALEFRLDSRSSLSSCSSAAGRSTLHPGSPHQLRQVADECVPMVDSMVRAPSRSSSGIRRPFRPAGWALLLAQEPVGVGVRFPEAGRRRHRLFEGCRRRQALRDPASPTSRLLPPPPPLPPLHSPSPPTARHPAPRARCGRSAALTLPAPHAFRCRWPPLGSSTPGLLRVAGGRM